MNQAYVLRRRKSLPRGLVLHLLLDPSLGAYKLQITRSETIVWQSPVPLTKDEGEELFDSHDLGLNTAFGFRAVLARCMGKHEEPSNPWQGSPAQAATMLFGLGTWEWVQALRAYREQAA